MTETVSEILVARAQVPSGFQRMIGWSIGAHVGLLLLFVLMPDSWRGVEGEVPRTVMTISLGGAPGPRAGGMTALGGRSVQVPAEPEPRRAEVPPAPTPPAMVLPTPEPPRPQPRSQEAPGDAVGRTPTTGAEVQQGNARAETGARGQGFGLTTGGGGGTNVQLDVGDFCCPEYLEQMMALIQRNWDSNHNVGGSTTMRFTIIRSGTIERVQVERPSGLFALDNAAQRALLLTRLPELPLQFPNPSLTVHMRFEYSR